MIYDLAQSFDIERCRMYLNRLIDKKAKIELTQKLKKRTLSQNALFHAWIKVFQEHIGETSFDSVKRDVKREILGMREVVNIFTGEVTTDDFRTSEMDTKQLAAFMDKFKIWAETEYGCYLPLPDDAGFNEMVERFYY